MNRQFDPRGHRTEDEQVSGIGVYLNMDFGTFDSVTFCSRPDFHQGKGLASNNRRARFWIGVGAASYSHGTTSIQCLHDPAAQLAEIVIDYCDRNLAQDLI